MKRYFVLGLGLAIGLFVSSDAPAVGSGIVVWFDDVTNAETSMPNYALCAAVRDANGAGNGNNGQNGESNDQNGDGSGNNGQLPEFCK